MTQYFAQLDDNSVVTQVIVASQDFINGMDGVWIETSMDGSIRKNYAGINYSYDPALDAFIPPKPYDSWVLDNETCQWQAPNPMPTDGKMYVWEEASLTWVEAQK